MDDSYYNGPKGVTNYTPPTGDTSAQDNAVGDNDESGFYDQRDDLVGGTDNMWTEYNSWGPSDDAPTTDIHFDFSGKLSQSDLAS